MCRLLRACMEQVRLGTSQSYVAHWDDGVMCTDDLIVCHNRRIAFSEPGCIIFMIAVQSVMINFYGDMQL